MKRIIALCAALLAGALFANEAAAQGPNGMPQPGAPPSSYGWHPKVEAFGVKHSTNKCGKPNLFGRMFGKTQTVPNAESGTLVFPNHPFSRSPRDFFMMDQ